MFELGRLRRGDHRDFVLEFLAVDGGAASTRARRVAALDHEGGDYAVEDCFVEVPPLGEGLKVGACLGRVGGVEFEGDGALLQNR